MYCEMGGDGMCCSGQASCCGGGPEVGVSVGVSVYSAPCLARMTDERGGEMCRGDEGSGDEWWVVGRSSGGGGIRSQPASQRETNSTDDLKLALPDDACLRFAVTLRLEARRHAQTINQSNK